MPAVREALRPARRPARGTVPGGCLFCALRGGRLVFGLLERGQASAAPAVRRGGYRRCLEGRCLGYVRGKGSGLPGGRRGCLPKRALGEAPTLLSAFTLTGQAGSAWALGCSVGLEVLPLVAPLSGSDPLSHHWRSAHPFKSSWYRFAAYSAQSERRFHAIVDSDSRASWTAPRESAAAAKVPASVSTMSSATRILRSSSPVSNVRIWYAAASFGSGVAADRS